MINCSSFQFSSNLPSKNSILSQASNVVWIHCLVFMYDLLLTQNSAHNRLQTIKHADVKTECRSIDLLWKKCCYQPVLSSNGFNNLASIYQIVSSKSAQDILQGNLELPFSSFGMQLLYFLSKKVDVNIEKMIDH